MIQFQQTYIINTMANDRHNETPLIIENEIYKSSKKISYINRNNKPISCLKLTTEINKQTPEEKTAQHILNYKYLISLFNKINTTRSY